MQNVMCAVTLMDMDRVRNKRAQLRNERVSAKNQTLILGGIRNDAFKTVFVGVILDLPTELARQQQFFRST